MKKNVFNSSAAVLSETFNRRFCLLLKSGWKSRHSEVMKNYFLTLFSWAWWWWLWYISISLENSEILKLFLHSSLACEFNQVVASHRKSMSLHTAAASFINELIGLARRCGEREILIGWKVSSVDTERRKKLEVYALFQAKFQFQGRRFFDNRGNCLHDLDFVYLILFEWSLTSILAHRRRPIKGRSRYFSTSTPPRLHTYIDFLCHVDITKFVVVE